MRLRVWACQELACIRTGCPNINWQPTLSLLFGCLKYQVLFIVEHVRTDVLLVLVHSKCKTLLGYMRQIQSMVVSFSLGTCCTTTGCRATLRSTSIVQKEGAERSRRRRPVLARLLLASFIKCETHTQKEKMNVYLPNYKAPPSSLPLLLICPQTKDILTGVTPASKAERGRERGMWKKLFAQKRNPIKIWEREGEGKKKNQIKF